jgi:RNA polymerase II subunit A small phosphatase-like protein
MPKQLLILDIDETLVGAGETPLAEVAPDFHVGPFAVYRRPYLAEFLSTVAGWFDVAVWSSASPSYVEGIVANVFESSHGLRFVWFCDRCTRRFDPETQEYFYIKDLAKVKKLGYSLEQILMIDDSPEKLSRHYGNHIRVRPFAGDRADSDLHDLLPFLNHLRTKENVRRIEKRHWRVLRF